MEMHEDEELEYRDIGGGRRRRSTKVNLDSNITFPGRHFWRDFDDTVEEPLDQSEWTTLPDLIMEKIYSYLSVRDRYNASMVCRRWNSAFYLPYVWRIFVFDEHTLTRRRFNYYSGWQHTLDHLRAQMCLGTVGRHFRVVIFTPVTNFYNMYEFMNMISYYAEQQGSNKHTLQGIGSNIKTLRYVFPCKYLSGDEESQHLHLYGTGGKLLAAVKRLMSNLRKLRHLELTDLMLDNAEALTLLDDVCCESCTSLRFLSLANITKGQCQLLHVGVFLNLQVLVVSPQNLGEDVVELLSFTKLKHLHLLQSRLTPTSAKPVNPKTWSAAVKRNSNFRVHLTLEAKVEREMIWQEQAPVSTVLFDSPLCKLDPNVIERVTQWYREQLQVFGHVGVPNYPMPDSFNDRNDPFLLMLVKDCPRLTTLVIREKISSSTVLLLLRHGKSLDHLYVRRDGVLPKCDWPRNPNWDQSYYDWLRRSSSTLEETEKEVTKILGYKWSFLSDDEFMTLSPDLY